MSGAPRLRRSMNVDDSEVRSVLGPAGNKAMRPVIVQKSSEKKSPDKIVSGLEKNKTEASSSPPSPLVRASSILRRQEQLLHSKSMNASCSSDASTDSFHSRASTGRINRTNSVGSRKKQCWLKPKVVDSDGGLGCLPDDSQAKRRCAWVTNNTDPCYAAFHDEEWGVPVHDDKLLFELLVLSGALAELTWPAILSKRQMFREVFADFDPIVVSKLSEKKIVLPGGPASSLLSEVKLRAIIGNAAQITKVICEFGSFDNYIWGFVNHKPINSRFRYPRQVPVKTPKADVISKDLVRRGFRSVGPTVIYSFMQVAGITNDHLISCFRFHECMTSTETKEENATNVIVEDKKTVDVMTESDISRAIDELSFCSE